MDTYICYTCLLLTMYCSFLFINDRVCHELYIHLYKLSMSVYVLYESVSCVCLWLSDEPVLYICMNNCCICFHVWMAPGKISFKLTGSPSLSKVFELNVHDMFMRPRPKGFQSYATFQILIYKCVHLSLFPVTKQGYRGILNTII